MPYRLKQKSLGALGSQPVVHKGIPPGQTLPIALHWLDNEHCSYMHAAGVLSYKIFERAGKKLVQVQLVSK